MVALVESVTEPMLSPPTRPLSVKPVVPLRPTLPYVPLTSLAVMVSPRVDLAVGVGERGSGQAIIAGVVAAQGQAGAGDGLAAAHIGRVVIAGGTQGDLVAADQRRERVIRAEAGGGRAVVGLLLDAPLSEAVRSSG